MSKWVDGYVDRWIDGGQCRQRVGKINSIFEGPGWLLLPANKIKNYDLQPAKKALANVGEVKTILQERGCWPRTLEHLLVLRLAVLLAGTNHVSIVPQFLCLLRRGRNTCGLSLSPQECHKGKWDAHTKCSKIFREDIYLRRQAFNNNNHTFESSFALFKAPSHALSQLGRYYPPFSSEGTEVQSD